LNPLSVSYSYTYYVTPAPDIYYSYLKYWVGRLTLAFGNQILPGIRVTMTSWPVTNILRELWKTKIA
jgi:hypothetical protein